MKNSVKNILISTLAILSIYISGDVKAQQNNEMPNRIVDEQWTKRELIGKARSIIETIENKKIFDSVERRLLRHMRALRIPGMQVAVVRGGKIICLKALGIANVEDSIAVSDSTVFPVHGVTRAIISVAIMQLVEQGKLDLSAPVSKYLDGLPRDWQKVTILHLLTNSSGLPDCWDPIDRVSDHDDDVSWVKTLGTSILFEPGGKYLLTHTNYVLLGKIIDRVSGMPFAQFVSTRQFDVAGMKCSGFGDARDVIPHLSRDYCFYREVHDHREETNSLQVAARTWPEFVWPSVGLNTSAKDLAQWTIALQEGKLIGKNTMAQMWKPVVGWESSMEKNGLKEGYSCGWEETAYEKRKVHAIMGGGKAAIYFFPDDDLTVIVSANLGVHAEPDRMAEAITTIINNYNP